MQVAWLGGLPHCDSGAQASCFMGSVLPWVFEVLSLWLVGRKRGPFPSLPLSATNDISYLLKFQGQEACPELLSRDSPTLCRGKQEYGEGS